MCPHGVRDGMCPTCHRQYIPGRRMKTRRKLKPVGTVLVIGAITAAAIFYHQSWMPYALSKINETRVTANNELRPSTPIAHREDTPTLARPTNTPVPTIAVRTGAWPTTCEQAFQMYDDGKLSLEETRKALSDVCHAPDVQILAISPTPTPKMPDPSITEVGADDLCTRLISRNASMREELESMLEKRIALQSQLSQLPVGSFRELRGRWESELESLDEKIDSHIKQSIQAQAVIQSCSRGE